MPQRELDISIISDVHLGTLACHAKELLQYLQSIKTKSLILNGDFIDIWEFRKKSFPKDHLAVLQCILKMAAGGTKVYYLTGNHDDVLRKFSPFLAGNIDLRDKLVLHIDQKKYWIFHGDIFDSAVTITPIIAKVAGRGYNWLIKLNRFINHVRVRLGYNRLSLANRVKRSVKGAVKYIPDFEGIAIDQASKQGYDYLICGHIHLPQIRPVEGRNLVYMNAGDCVENLTALEYRFRRWSLYYYDPDDFQVANPRLKLRQNRPTKLQMFQNALLNED